MGFLKKSIVAIIFVLIALFIIVFLRQINILWFDALMLLFLFIASFEIDSAFRKIGYNTIRPMFIMSLLAIYPMFLLFNMNGAILTVILSFMVGATIMTFNHQYTYKDLAVTSFTTVYPMLFIILFAEINHNTGGFFGIMAILSIAILSDTFAQWIGMLVKGKKLCPTISPNKTVAGAVGAYVGGMVAVLGLFLIFEYFQLFVNVQNIYFSGLTSSPIKSVPIYIVMALLGTTASQLGDLTASWLKRQFGLKDFSAIVPGHGGIMDRADSIIFTGPILYLIFLFIPALQL